MNEQKFDSSFELYNLILNALIALELEKQKEELPIGLSKETLFLGAWLKQAKKQQRYPKRLALEIDNLLNIYRLKGRNANLSILFNQMMYEYRIVKGVDDKTALPAKTRFDLAMNKLKQKGWQISLPIVDDASLIFPYRTQTKEVFTSQKYWHRAFNDQEQLAKQTSIFVVSKPQQVIDYLYEQGFILIKGVEACDKQGKYYYQYILFPENKCTGKPAIPSIIKS